MLQDLTGLDQQIQYAYEVSVRGCRIPWVRDARSNMSTAYQDGAAGSHGFGTTNRTCLRGIRTVLQVHTGFEQQIQHAYEVLGQVPEWGCRNSRVDNTKSNMPTKYQVWAAGSHRFGTPDRACLWVTRTRLHGLTGSGHQNRT